MTSRLWGRAMLPAWSSARWQSSGVTRRPFLPRSTHALAADGADVRAGDAHVGRLHRQARPCARPLRWLWRCKLSRPRVDHDALAQALRGNPPRAHDAELPLVVDLRDERADLGCSDVQRAKHLARMAPRCTCHHDLTPHPLSALAKPASTLRTSGGPSPPHCLALALAHVDHLRPRALACDRPFPPPPPAQACPHRSALAQPHVPALRRPVVQARLVRIVEARSASGRAACTTPRFSSIILRSAGILVQPPSDWSTNCSGGTRACLRHLRRRPRPARPCS